MAEPHERPVLFGGEMVRRILDDADPKTQTRRVVKGPIPSLAKTARVAVYDDDGPCAGLWPDLEEHRASNAEVRILCPYGKPGDRLWVRETWGIAHEQADVVPWYQQREDAKRRMPWAPVVYRATDLYALDVSPWKPSIHMPRWASRITLEVTEVRVERVQEISTMDAMAEGAAPRPVADGTQSYTHGFHVLWDSINAKRGFGWDTNPWVWAVSFRRIQP